MVDLQKLNETGFYFFRKLILSDWITLISIFNKRDVFFIKLTHSLF